MLYPVARGSQTGAELRVGKSRGNSPPYKWSHGFLPSWSLYINVSAFLYIDVYTKKAVAAASYLSLGVKSSDCEITVFPPSLRSADRAGAGPRSGFLGFCRSWLTGRCVTALGRLLVLQVCFPKHRQDSSFISVCLSAVFEWTSKWYWYRFFLRKLWHGFSFLVRVKWQNDLLPAQYFRRYSLD